MTESLTRYVTRQEQNCNMRNVSVSNYIGKGNKISKSNNYDQKTGGVGQYLPSQFSNMQRVTEIKSLKKAQYVNRYKYKSEIVPIKEELRSKPCWTPRDLKPLTLSRVRFKSINPRTLQSSLHLQVIVCKIRRENLKKLGHSPQNNLF